MCRIYSSDMCCRSWQRPWPERGSGVASSPFAGAERARRFFRKRAEPSRRRVSRRRARVAPVVEWDGTGVCFRPVEEILMSTAFGSLSMSSSLLIGASAVVAPALSIAACSSDSKKSGQRQHRRQARAGASSTWRHGGTTSRAGTGGRGGLVRTGNRWHRAGKGGAGGDGGHSVVETDGGRDGSIPDGGDVRDARRSDAH